MESPRRRLRASSLTSSIRATDQQQLTQRRTRRAAPAGAAPRSPRIRYRQVFED